MREEDVTALITAHRAQLRARRDCAFAQRLARGCSFETLLSELEEISLRGREQAAAREKNSPRLCDSIDKPACSVYNFDKKHG